MRHTFAAAAIATIALLTGCASHHGEHAIGAEPRMVASSTELVPLAFMAGRWVEVSPNGTIQEEHWMAPRGKSMMAMFRRVLGNGEPVFHELVSVTAEPEGVLLRLRHFHAKLEARGAESEIMVLKLAQSGQGPDGELLARFDAVDNTRGVTSVTYRQIDAGTLTVTINFEPELKRETDVATIVRLGASK